MPKSISDLGVKFLAQFEARSDVMYNDAAGNCTIGIGHKIHDGPCDGTEDEEFKNGLTEDELLYWLSVDLDLSQRIVSGYVTVPLTQAQYDALVSLVFNIGAGNFIGSDILKVLNTGNYNAIPDLFVNGEWVYAVGYIGPVPGLVRRRQMEADLFSKGIYNFNW
jgi:GH24 family phage-related lysozyme (muramidase)